MSALGDRIQFHCPSCGPVNLQSKSVRLFQCKEDGWLTVSFRCRMCFSKQRIAATSLAVQELAFHGIAAETWSVQDAYWPAASVRARKYRRRFWMRKQATFTSQDCNRLRADMEKVDWFVKLMASVGGAGK